MHITVLIPAFNTANYIGACIQSILSQTHKDYDILVVNDGSTDRTQETVETYIPNNPVSILNEKKNNGVTHATHLGILNAQGPIITIVDSDDLIFPYSLKTGLKPFVDPDVGFVWTQFVKNTGGMGWSKPLPYKMTLWRAMMYKHWWEASHQKFFKKQVYMDGVHLNTKIKKSSDFQLVLLLALSGCKTIHVPEVTYWYRMRRPGSITSEGGLLQKRATREARKWLRKEMQRRSVDEPAW